MTPSDDLDRLGRRLRAARQALEQGLDLDAEQFLALVQDVEVLAAAGSETEVGTESARLLALLDEADRLRATLERERDAIRQTLQAAARRRRGWTAYQTPARS
ncbi:MAG: hypothetical protein R3349_01570 [Geminicoccaceae bacterium]|nr:hypothetical protein [Geminicoccaceae bacterium]